MSKTTIKTRYGSYYFIWRRCMPWRPSSKCKHPPLCRSNRAAGLPPTAGPPLSAWWPPSWSCLGGRHQLDTQQHIYHFTTSSTWIGMFLKIMSSIIFKNRLLYLFISKTLRLLNWPTTFEIGVTVDLCRTLSLTNVRQTLV
jgi:hypothetical protein